MVCWDANDKCNTGMDQDTTQAKELLTPEDRKHMAMKAFGIEPTATDNSNDLRPELESTDQTESPKTSPH